MADPFMHLFVPAAILFSLNFNKRKVLYLLPFALFPDIDFLFFHRALLHNIFIPLILSSLTFYLTKDKEYSKIMFIMITTHYFLDLNGVALLFPFFPYKFNLLFNVTATYPTITISPNFYFSIEELRYKPYVTYPFEPLSFYIFLVILFIAIFSKSHTKKLLKKIKSGK